MTSTGILPVEGLAVIFGVYRFMSMAIAHVQHDRQQRGDGGGRANGRARSTRRLRNVICTRSAFLRARRLTKVSRMATCCPKT